MQCKESVTFETDTSYFLAHKAVFCFTLENNWHIKSQFRVILTDYA